jgi:hypothetical protein
MAFVIRYMSRSGDRTKMETEERDMLQARCGQARNAHWSPASCIGGGGCEMTTRVVGNPMAPQVVKDARRLIASNPTVALLACIQHFPNRSLDIMRRSSYRGCPCPYFEVVSKADKRVAPYIVHQAAADQDYACEAVPA